MAEKEQMPAGCMTMPTKGPQHDSLARFAGTWRADVKFMTDPAQPPHVSQGTMTNTVLFGGLFLEQKYADNSGRFEGRGFWGYNTIEERFEGFWIDPMATCFQLERGQHDKRNDTYTMTGTMTDPTTRKSIKKRSVITVKGPDEHMIEMFFEGQGGRENKCMEIRYTRA